MRKTDCPAQSTRRVGSIFTNVIQDLDASVRSGTLTEEELISIVMATLAATIQDGDKPSAARKIKLAESQVRLLKDLIRQRDEKAFQEQLSNRMNAIEIQLQKDHPR